MTQADSGEDFAQQFPSETEVAYWRSRSPQERLAHLEVLRREAYFAGQAKLGKYSTETLRMRKGIITIIRAKDKR